MNYLLAVLTHGDNEAIVSQALDAFYEHVVPVPFLGIVHRDEDPQCGFCGATAELWRQCAESEADYVFWLEHDFLISRPVGLAQIAAVLDARPQLAQMALMRDAYSAEEHAAGGLYELRRDDFTEHETTIIDPTDDSPQPGFWQPYWLQQPWFTTNPSLMRRDFMAEHPFLDDGQPYCEGRFGIALREQGFEFGTWGSGEVWCRHVGHRDGSGHGY